MMFGCGCVWVHIHRFVDQLEAALSITPHRLVDIGARSEKGGVEFDILIHPKASFTEMLQRSTGGWFGPNKPTLVPSASDVAHLIEGLLKKSRRDGGKGLQMPTFHPEQVC